MMVTAILCSDLHLRDSSPVGRTDDYFKAQEKKIKFIRDLQKELTCPIICAGDLFHKAKSSPFLEAWTIRNLPKMSVIAGQHDLLNHNFDLLNSSSLGVLIASGVIDFIGYRDGMSGQITIGDSEILALHTFVQKPKDIQDKQIGGSAAIALLKKHPEYDLIVTGDNHKPFVSEYQGRKLVNCGSMMRMTTAQKEHRPRVYLWHSKDNCIEKVFLPRDEDVFDSSHIDTVKERDSRMEAFVERIKDDCEFELSFEKNLEIFFKANKIRKPVKDIVWEAAE